MRKLLGLIVCASLCAVLGLGSTGCTKKPEKDKPVAGVKDKDKKPPPAADKDKPVPAPKK
jgi:hypothetical protein